MPKQDVIVLEDTAREEKLSHESSKKPNKYEVQEVSISEVKYQEQ